MAFLKILPVLFMALGSTGLVRPAADWQSKVDPWVLAHARVESTTEFVVFLTEQADLSAAASLPTKQAKGAYVYAALSALAADTQAPLLAQLQARGVEHRAYWIANMIWVHAGLDTVEAMARREDVAHIYANPSVQLEGVLNSGAPDSAAAPAVVEWNIAKISAPLVWQAGFTGQGVVVGGQDTGYQWDHPALKRQYRGWDGAAANHDYSWHDAIHSGSGPCGANSPVPCDDNGHGTHTMGTMVGDDGLGNQIGVAPGARWIGCRNMDRGIGTPSTYSECYQWFLAPTTIAGAGPDPSKAPDVINNSWSCPPSEGCTNPAVLQVVVDNVRAAGIVTVHSAGNSGSACATVDTPAAIYDASLTVGATSRNDGMAAFSSRGPVTVDGSNRLKPDISAPGVDIRSSVAGGGYRGGWSGTSMAGPHVAGVVALLLAARPDWAGQVDQLEQVIGQTAVPIAASQSCGGVPGTAIPNNTAGYGRIDAYAAYRAAQLPTAVRLAVFEAEATAVNGAQHWRWLILSAMALVALGARWRRRRRMDSLVRRNDG